MQALSNFQQPFEEDDTDRKERSTSTLAIVEAIHDQRDPQPPPQQNVKTHTFKGE